MTPRVSVALAARNEERRIAAAIDSVLAQTYADWELVVVDDGSIDGTAAVVAAYADPRIRVLRTPPRGLASALNCALEHASGEFFARQDADDTSLPERFARQVEFLEHHPHVAVAGTAWREVDPRGRVVRPRVAFVAGHVNGCLLRFNPLTHTTVMARRQALLRVGGYRTSLRFAQDYDLWLRLDEAGETLWNLPDVLAVRAMTGDNVAARREREQIRAEIAIRLRDLRRRHAAGRPFAAGVRPLTRRLLSLAAPLALKRIVRRRQGKAE